jgi:hypothetical protein
MANDIYWSVSQFKEFDRCEACGLASVRGLYRREETDALLIGSYVDAYFSGELGEFIDAHRDVMFSKRGGGLLAKFQKADEIIKAVNKQPLMLDYLTGDKQVIQTAELFGVPWKIKMDVYRPGERIVDLKCVKDFGDLWDETYGGRRSWIEYWGYDIQGAVYQRVVEAVTGKKLPFYIAAVTKEKTPDVAVIQIPQHILDAAYGLVSAKIERFDLIKTGEVEPIRCEKCEYCKTTKVLMEPEVYEIDEVN